MQDVTEQVNILAERIHQIAQTQPRVVVALCGAPASGKSTLADEVARRLNLQKRKTVVVPMDGFHLDNAILDARGLRPRKGAPESFDGVGFYYLIKRLKEAREVIAPAFDRSRDLSVAGAICVPAEAEVVLVEGNYLMFDEEPWRHLAPLWDLTVQLDVPIEQLRARLIQRWLSHNLSRTAATRRAESNDIPNAERVLAASLPCDINLSNA